MPSCLLYFFLSELAILFFTPSAMARLYALSNFRFQLRCYAIERKISEIRNSYAD